MRAEFFCCPFLSGTSGITSEPHRALQANEGSSPAPNMQLSVTHLVHTPQYHH